MINIKGNAKNIEDIKESGNNAAKSAPGSLLIKIVKNENQEMRVCVP